MTRYSRQDVIRILHLHTRQLLAWERAGLITSSEHYSFESLGQLRKLRDLQATTRISAKSIRASVDAMQRVAGMRNPLMEASFVRRGSRLSFRHGGALMDPLTQQLAFDFDTSPSRQLSVVGAGDASVRRAAETQDMFLRAVQLEEIRFDAMMNYADPRRRKTINTNQIVTRSFRHGDEPSRPMS